LKTCFHTAGSRRPDSGQSVATTTKRIILLMPILMTVSLLLWWALTEKYSSYGSWHAYPALAILPLVLVWHIGLIVLKRPRMPLVMYAGVHLVFFVPIWFNCVMWLTHDSL
jgi:glycerol-3-phosphate acyltransferase PlsY